MSSTCASAGLLLLCTGAYLLSCDPLPVVGISADYPLGLETAVSGVVAAAGGGAPAAAAAASAAFFLSAPPGGRAVLLPSPDDWLQLPMLGAGELGADGRRRLGAGGLTPAFLSPLGALPPPLTGRLNATCNADCGCRVPREKFAPVCGEDGRTYFSACRAGCVTQAGPAGGGGAYLNCSCIPAPAGAGAAAGGSAETGSCAVGGNCSSGLLLFAFLMLCAGVSQGLVITLAGVFIVRALPPRLVSPSMAVLSAFQGIFSQTLPTFALGILMDLQCLYNGPNLPSCPNGPKNCQIYDPAGMRSIFLASTIILCGIVLALFLGAWRALVVQRKDYAALSETTY